MKTRFPLYSKLLKLYPSSYRERYEEEMLLITSDMLDNVQDNKDKLFLWSKILADLPINIAKQNLEYAGGIMRQSMPNYIKRNSVISGALLLPFAIALVANLFDVILYDRSLRNNGLWQKPEMLVWVLYLPALALLVTAASYLYFVFKGENSNRKWLKRASDIIRSWPVLLVGAFAFGILTLVEFHDSTQCITKSPVHAASNASQTLHCVESNRTIIPRQDF